MQHDAACMLKYSQRSKFYFIHACLHALDLRTRAVPGIGETKSKYELATGILVDATVFRVWGADMYGMLLPEKRKQMRFDKADPYAKYGVYVGNSREKPSWKLAAVIMVFTSLAQV